MIVLRMLRWGIGIRGGGFRFDWVGMDLRRWMQWLFRSFASISRVRIAFGYNTIQHTCVFIAGSVSGEVVQCQSKRYPKSQTRDPLSARIWSVYLRCYCGYRTKTEMTPVTHYYYMRKGNPQTTEIAIITPNPTPFDKQTEEIRFPSKPIQEIVQMIHLMNLLKAVPGLAEDLKVRLLEMVLKPGILPSLPLALVLRSSPHPPYQP